MTNGVGLLGAGGTVSIVNVLLAQNPPVPVGRWIRWRITLSGGGAKPPWDATFRVLGCGNSSGEVR